MKIGVYLLGANGNIATTLTTGTFQYKKKNRRPIGLLTELDEVKVIGHKFPTPKNVFFAGCDINKLDHIEAAYNNNTVAHPLIKTVANNLAKIDILHLSKNDLLSSAIVYRKIVFHINKFKRTKKLDCVIVVNLTSTTGDKIAAKKFQREKKLQRAIKNNEPIPFGIIYAYAAIIAGAPYINFTPNVSCEIPAIIEAANTYGIPICGKDGKTGQTLYKLILASLFKWRNLLVHSWYSTNMLGNNDGKALQKKENLRLKYDTKASGLFNILKYTIDQQIHIHYIMHKGDAKEAWDSIEFSGWLDIPMSMKINWLGHDSALAAPLVFDLVRLMHLFYTKKIKGLVPELGCFFKAPHKSTTADFSAQINQLLDKLRSLKSKI